MLFIGINNNLLISSLEALQKIEEIVSDDFSHDIQFDLYKGGFKIENEKIMAEKLTKIYKIAHAWNPDHECFASHENWRKEE